MAPEDDDEDLIETVKGAPDRDASPPKGDKKKKKKKDE